MQCARIAQGIRVPCHTRETTHNSRYSHSPTRLGQLTLHMVGPTSVAFTSRPTRPILPTKRPIVALTKQARAFDVGVLVATQNPMDVDYRALGNAGVLCIGRLQTDADCARVLDGLSSTDTKGFSTATLGKVIKNLAPRWFVMRDVHARVGTILLQPRWAMSYLRGPMTRNEIRKARERFGDGAAQDDEEKSGVVQHRDTA